MSDGLVHTTGTHLFALPVWTAQDVLRAGDAAAAQIEEMGVRTARGNRLTRARGLLRRIERGRTVPGHTDVSRDEVAQAMRTVVEFFFIVRAVDPLDPLVRDKLAQCLGGSDNAEEEDTRARDTQFEMFVAALLRYAGIRGVHLGEPDVRIPAGDEVVGVAVKRLSSAKKLTTRLRDALRQLAGQGQRGAAVLDVAPLVTGPDAASMSTQAKAATDRCRGLLRTLAGGDAAFVLFAIALVPMWSDQDPRIVAVHAACSLDVLAPPEEQSRVLQFLGRLGRNVVQALHRETYRLRSGC